jgi:ketosteroid isomerase-like protein
MWEPVVTAVDIRGSRRRSRNIEERFIVRFPALYRRGAALMFRLLSPSSRLRRYLLRRAVIIGWTSFDRRDYELNTVFFAPNIELEFPPGMETLGFDGSYRGHDGRIEGLEKVYEVWGISEFHPGFLVDLGDRLLIVGSWRSEARGSGALLEQEYAQLITIRDGLVVRDQNFFSWDEGLRAAELDRDALALPDRGTRTAAASFSER